MKNRRCTGMKSWRISFAMGLMLSLVVGIGSASAEQLDPDADEVLRSMSTYLGGLSSFSVEGELDNEIINFAGQKLQYSSSSSIVAQRPDKMYVNRKGLLGNVELIFDGKLVTLYGKKKNKYFQKEAAGTIDDLVGAIDAIGVDAPGADLLYADAYKGLIDGVISSSYHGIVYVGGVECYYLSFREKDIDWQLWVKTGEKPLPVKYIITTKWMTAAPQYSIRYRNWNTSPKIGKDQFTFSAPKGATKLTAISANELGNPVMEEVKK